MRPIFENLVAGEGDPLILSLVQAELEKGEHFVLWLEAEMGAGKTTFVRHYLYALGLPLATPVVSPTYTLVNEYKVGDRWYAHLDLYRAEARFSLDELGIRDTRSYFGTFIEWPEQPASDDRIPATHFLRIDSVDLNARRYSFYARTS